MSDSMLDHRPDSPDPILVRPVEPADVARWVAIRNEGDSEPVAVDAFRPWILRQTATSHRFVAQIDGLVVGYAAAMVHPLWPDRLMAGVKVEQASRRRGIGSRLLRAIDSIDLEPPVTFLQAPVLDNDQPSRAWAEGRGFAVGEHRFQSMLSLAGRSFPVVAPSSNIERVSGSDALFAFFSSLIRDAPDGATPPDRDWFFSHLLERSAVFVASEDDEWLGLTILQIRSRKNAYNFFTGVIPRARGRGIARNLKLAAIAEAQSRGIVTITTDNSSANEPMIALNRRLGYLPMPGQWLMHRPLQHR
jgi:GNAT superfamily N-acetyltransferase